MKKDFEMDNRVVIRIKRDKKEDLFYTVCKELEEHGVSYFGIDAKSAVKGLMSILEEKIKGAQLRNPELFTYLTNLHITFEPDEDCKLKKKELKYIMALNLMLDKHYGQKDKAGQNYCFHPFRVSLKCGGHSELVALLHDVLEDTPTTSEDLLKFGFSETIVDGVVAMTHKIGESYAEYVDRCKNHELAKPVKLSDLEDNMTITRYANIEEHDVRRLNKYLHAWRFIKGLEPDTSLIVE